MPYIETRSGRLLFIHIPKTGGTSIEESMKTAGRLCLCSRTIPPSLKVPPEHFTWSDVSSLFPEEYFDYAFAVVRNPYDRMESEYRMRSLLYHQGLWGAMPRFSVWLANSLQQASRDRFYLANHFRPQVDFLGSGVHIFRFEDGLDRIMGRVSRDAGVTLALPEERHLSSAAFDNAIQWDAQDIHLVNEFFRADFVELHYEVRSPGFKISPMSDR